MTWLMLATLLLGIYMGMSCPLRLPEWTAALAIVPLFFVGFWIVRKQQ